MKTDVRLSTKFVTAQNAHQVGVLVTLAGEAPARRAPLNSAEFAELLDAEDEEPRRFSVSPASGDGEQDVVELAQRAVAERRVLTILYAAEHDLASAARSVEPHQVAYAEGRWYVVAWCRRGEG